jgi:lysozyme family protein
MRFQPAAEQWSSQPEFAAMQSTHPKAMSYLRISEGGYVNHHKDPGGATNFGITQAVYDAYRKNKAKQSVKLITEAEVAATYKTQYADKVRYDDLPAGWTMRPSMPP